MKTKQNYLKVALLLTAFTLLPSAQPAMAKDQVPFKGIEVGATSDGGFDFPFATILDTSEGEATHLGHFTKTGIILIDVISMTVTGIFTLTAANGDELFLIGTGDASPPSIHQETVLKVTVTGGTGRFNGATGDWTEVSDFAFPFGETSVDPYAATLEGAISTPGANK